MAMPQRRARFIWWLARDNASPVRQSDGLASWRAPDPRRRRIGPTFRRNVSTSRSVGHS